MAGLPGAEQIILAVDSSDEDRALELVQIAEEAGASTVKLGLELATATDWEFCSGIAERHGLQWVADAKLDDIPNTVVGAVKNLAALPHPPFAITMHTTAGIEAMTKAQEAAGVIKMLGVTILTSVTPEEAEETYGVSRLTMVKKLAHNAVKSGLAGVVASPKEVGALKDDAITGGLFAMIPGTRPKWAAANDQANVELPRVAIEAGADALVIGRPITGAEKPAEAFARLISEIRGEA